MRTKNEISRNNSIAARVNLLAVVIFIFSAVSSFSQIPNNRFEDWTNAGTYLTPDGWWTPNDSATGNYYPVTRSTDHYPLSVGNYSLRMENNVSILPDWGGIGIAWTGGWEGNNYPAFPIIGHPQSLCGYYKFIPQNNDTMEIHIRLYKNGVDVGGGQFKNSSAVLNWTSFTMSFSNYTEADSARIMILSCYNNDAPVPQGNSVLFIDNLNFDSLIVDGISEINEKNSFIIYPNPAMKNLTIDFGNENTNPVQVVIYDAKGNKVLDRQVFLVNGKSSLDVSNYASGLYFVGITVDDRSYHYRKLIIEK